MFYKFHKTKVASCFCHGEHVERFVKLKHSTATLFMVIGYAEILLLPQNCY